MLKLLTLLLAYTLISSQVYSSHAAASRAIPESMSDQVTSANYDAQRLLGAVIKRFMLINWGEQEQQAAEEERSGTVQKRGCNTATCVTQRLGDFLSRTGGIGSSNFVPTNVGAHAFGRRRRQSHI